MAFVHPFDDPDVVAGQGTLGLELLEDVPDLAKVVVPVGGGGLASGVAIAVKSARPEVEVVGVQVETRRLRFPPSLRRGEPVERRPGAHDRRRHRRQAPRRAHARRWSSDWLDDVVVVPEDDVAEAMVLLMEKAKLVVEGAGAVGVAALLGGADRGRGARHDGRRALAAATSTPGLLASIARRHETRGRPAARAVSRACPTARARWRGCSRSSARRARTSSTSSTCARASTCTCARPAVQLVLETRGREHADDVLARVRDAGYEARVVR